MLVVKVDFSEATVELKNAEIQRMVDNQEKRKNKILGHLKQFEVFTLSQKKHKKKKRNKGLTSCNIG